MKIIPFERDEWIKKYQESSYKEVFNADLPLEAKQSFFDKAFVVFNDEKEPVIYCTVKQLTEKALFIEFGGSFPKFRSSPKVVKYFKDLCAYFNKAGAEVVALTTLNTNVSMQKLALYCGFIPMGVSMSKEGLMIDFQLDFRKKEDILC